MRPDPEPEGADAFALAGGRSLRMGQDKALLLLGGRPLLEIALEKLRALNVQDWDLASAPRIAGARSDVSSLAPIVADLHPDCGPLGGIEAALTASTRPLTIFLPVDLPLLPAQFPRWMLLRAQVTGALMTVPRLNGMPQPLCAVYHRSLLAAITAALVAGNYKVMPAVMAAAAGQAHPQPIDVFDVELVASTNRELLSCSSLPLHQWFYNCNTPEDMAAVENALVWS